MNTCANCTWWTGQRDAADPKRVVGDCHVMPPVVIGLPVRTLAGEGWKPVTALPNTSGAHRCSLWRHFNVGGLDD